MSKSKEGRGGTREGAGRPSKGDTPRIRKTFTLDPEVGKALEYLSIRNDVSQSDIVNKAIRSVLNGLDEQWEGWMTPEYARERNKEGAS